MPVELFHVFTLHFPGFEYSFKLMQHTNAPGGLPLVQSDCAAIGASKELQQPGCNQFPDTPRLEVVATATGPED